MIVFGKSSGGGRRDGTREAAPLTILLTTLSKTYEALLVDISATGARVRGDELPAIGDELFMSASTIKTFCTVRWRKDGECGVQFYEPLLQAEVVGLRREVTDGCGLTPAMKAAQDDWVLGIFR